LTDFRKWALSVFHRLRIQPKQIQTEKGAKLDGLKTTSTVSIAVHKCDNFSAYILLFHRISRFCLPLAQLVRAWCLYVIKPLAFPNILAGQSVNCATPRSADRDRRGGKQALFLKKSNPILWISLKCVLKFLLINFSWKRLIRCAPLRPSSKTTSWNFSSIVLLRCSFSGAKKARPKLYNAETQPPGSWARRNKASSAGFLWEHLLAHVLYRVSKSRGKISVIFCWFT